MAQKVQFRRLLTLAMLLCLAFAGLGYRLVDLQVLRHDELDEKARRQSEREFLRLPRRGDILDSKGNALATSVFMKTVCADPTLIGGRQPEVARTIAPLLQLPEADVYQRLLPRIRQDASGKIVTNHYVVLKRKVPLETFLKIQQAMTNLNFGFDSAAEKKLPRARREFFNRLRHSAVFADRFDEQLRVYPNQRLAAHVLGYVGVTEREIAGAHVRQIAGMDGIERAFNSKLDGTSGLLETEVDRRGREIVPLRNQDLDPRDGFNVVLTIDSVLQHSLESALADAMQRHGPISVSGLIVRPRTGEILGMATLPNFDPNNPGGPPEHRRNRVITDVLEPGSTFKIVVVSGALNNGVVQLNDVFDCEHGRFAYAGRILHDHESYGPLSVEGIITKSSNIGAAKIGIKLGEERLYGRIREYGFGAKTGIPLVGEVPGYVPPVKNWYKVSLAQIPMGHGIAVTRLQMALAMCAIANGGVLMRPMLVDRLEYPDGRLFHKYSPEVVRRVISEAAARDMVKALKTVTTSEGTAPKAALEYYDVAGKTGTAQKAGPGGYMPGKYFSSFVGFFPADNPEVCISIVFDEPKQGYYGGQVAAPVFKDVAQKAASYLNIRPDRGGDDAALAQLSDKTNRVAEKVIAARKP